MNERTYKKRLDFQKNLITRQSGEIESLKKEIDNLTLKLAEKDKIINSVASLREELSRNVEEVKKHKNEYKSLIEELRKMKEIINKTVYKGRWRLIKFLIK